MSNVNIKAQWATHEGGTKFYGAILFENNSGSSYLIKVHGPVGAKGRVIAEPYGAGGERGYTEYLKIIDAKSRRGYNFREVLNRGTGDFRGGHDEIVDSAVKMMQGMGVKMASAYKLDMLTAIRSLAKDDVDLIEELTAAGITSMPKEPEIARSEEWGSW